MATEGLKELYIDELKDLYSAEKQLVKALPKMAKAAMSSALRSGFQQHLQQTENQVQRLETIFEQLEESPKGKRCKGMEGLVEEGEEAMEDYEGSLLDVALIGAAQRVEHYEMAGYGTAIALASELDESEHISLLTETLEEEKLTDAKLSKLASVVNANANKDTVQDEEKRGSTKKSRRAA